MRNTKKALLFGLICAVLNFTAKAYATDFYIDGKGPVSKGEALIAKAKNDKLKVTKVDEMEISKKGTLVKKD